jgi:rhodanese-related sulfurtransferase
VTRAGDLTPEQAWALLAADPAAVLVDVRTRAEWAFVGMPDLRGLGKRVLPVEWVAFPSGAPNTAFLDQLEATGVARTAPVAFLCRSGHRSVGAAEAATAAGWTAAYNVLDGFEGHVDAEGHRGSTGWRACGLPWQQS